MYIWERLQILDGTHGDSDSDNSTEYSTDESDDEDARSSTSEESRKPGSRRGRKRPPYRTTIQQDRSWAQFCQGVEQVVAGTDTIGRYTECWLERSCLDAVIQLFNHPLKSGQHYESIVISALAVMGVEPGRRMDTGCELHPSIFSRHQGSPVFSVIPVHIGAAGSDRPVAAGCR